MNSVGSLVNSESVKCSSFDELIQTYHTWDSETFNGRRQAHYSCGPSKGIVSLQIYKNPEFIERLNQLGITKIWKDWIYIIESSFSNEKYMYAKVQIKNLDFDEVDCVISSLFENKVTASLFISNTFSHHRRSSAQPLKIKGLHLESTWQNGIYYKTLEKVEFDGRIADSINTMQIDLLDCGEYLHLKENVPVCNEFLNEIKSKQEARGIPLLNNYFPKI